MSPLAELFRAAGAGFARAGAAWYLFGAQAAILHGAARLTADVDLTVALGEGSVEDLLASLEQHGFAARIADPIAFAQRTRVLLLVHRDTGIPVDVVMAGPGIEEQFLERAEPRMVGDVPVPVVRAEDLVAMKILAGRAKDMEDAVAVIAAQGERLDPAMVRATLAQLERALDRADLAPLFDEALRRAAR